MKRYVVYITISALALLVPNKSFACWSGWYDASEYFMFRVCETDVEDVGGIQQSDPQAYRNCKEWQNLTSDTILLQDIYQVVYKTNLSDMEKSFSGDKWASGNGFTHWLMNNDKALRDYLLLSKNNEDVRQQRNSRWYYPSMKTSGRMSLEQIADTALARATGRLKHRYLLQAVRALFTLRRYEECLQIWSRDMEPLPEDNLMRMHVKPYIAGAMMRLGHREQALRYYAEMGDAESLAVYGGDGDNKLYSWEALEIVCRYAPNSPAIPKALQKLVRQLEPGYPSWCFSCDDKITQEGIRERVYALGQRMLRNPQTRDRAMWYYTLAFLDDIKGNTSRACQLLAKAEKAPSSPLMGESIKVLRIYLDAKTRTYNSAYYRLLHTQLQWLDRQIRQNLSAKVCEETAEFYKLHSHLSFYYWNDVMRRILLSVVCPRMLEQGNAVRALQLANMADNHLLNIVDKEFSVHTGRHYLDPSQSQTHSITHYRYDSDQSNPNDYSNHFFEMIDSIGVEHAVRYAEVLRRPRDKFDAFLNQCGYVNADYLNDIIGTQYLRRMDYAKAFCYLGAVSEGYKNHINTTMCFDPFAVKATRISPTHDFKYDFAREMSHLQQCIASTADPNRRARLMLRFATGMRNSFKVCWHLTQYYKGECYIYQVCDKRQWEADRYTTAALRRSDALVREALDIVTDSSLAAEMQYTLCNFATVARLYPNTPHGELVRGSCDNLKDYRPAFVPED